MADAIELYLTNPVEALLEDDEISLPEEYNDFTIIREMGWDWETFQNQPTFFIKQCRAFMMAEQKARQNRKLDNPNNGR